MSCRLLSIAASLLPTSCAAVPQGGLTQATCLIAGSSDWSVKLAKPGSDRQPMLTITGKVTVPTGGYRPILVIEQIAGSYPVQAFARLHPNPPAGGATQAIVTHEVRDSWPMSTPVVLVTVRCGSQMLAQVSPIDTVF
jgi:hypothetical protein